MAHILNPIPTFWSRFSQKRPFSSSRDRFSHRGKSPSRGTERPRKEKAPALTGASLGDDMYLVTMLLLPPRRCVISILLGVTDSGNSYIPLKGANVRITMQIM